MTGLASKTAADLIPLLESGDVLAQDVMQDTLNRIAEVESGIQSYIMLREYEELMEEARKVDCKRSRGVAVGPLAGLPIAVKDNICTLGLRTTCASQILRNFVPPYSASVVERIEQADGIVIGKTNLDEFAMGSSTENSSYQITRNPWNPEYVTGGSSGGSAAAVTAGECVLSLGSDTGGSIRLPASFCGLVGIKPTYGRVSRHGLVAYGSSLDQIGPFGRCVEDAALLLQVIAGCDPCDSTSVNVAVPDYQHLLRQTPDHKLRVGLPAEYFGDGLDDEVSRSVLHAVDMLAQDGAIIKKISLSTTPYAIPTYYLVACSEASSNLARYDGVAYGSRASDANDVLDMMTKTRDAFLGKEVKLRIMLGTYALSAGYYDQYYLKAMKVRSLIADDFRRAFADCDVIVHPVAPTTAYKIGEKINDPIAMYLGDIYTVTANLAGIPAVAIPCGMNQQGLPIGLQIAANHFDELTMLQTAYRLEQLLANKGSWPGPYRIDH